VGTEGQAQAGTTQRRLEGWERDFGAAHDMLRVVQSEGRGA
jgi:hypothetical protein